MIFSLHKFMIKACSVSLLACTFMLTFGFDGSPVYPWSSKTPPIPLPDPDPLSSSGDALYSVYRKGLITRHITVNGRLLQITALESIDDFAPEKYDNRGHVSVTDKNGNLIRQIPVDNIRYSEEYLAGSRSDHKPHMWVPVVAPIKNPGYRNDGYDVVAGGGDNPCYYGGMALAMFALEHIYGVSRYAIEYARRLMGFFIKSEMNGPNGYIIRRPNYFNSTRNLNGEPILQGASAEELLGLMLGIMYYLKAEDPAHPLYAEATELRNRVLARAGRTSLMRMNYRHKFMLSSHHFTYPVFHFRFPLFASKGDLGVDDRCRNKPPFGKGTGDNPSGQEEIQYFDYMFKSAGTSRSALNRIPGVQLKFQDYAQYLTSIILLMDGDIPVSRKKYYAEKIMKHYIKAATKAGPDTPALKQNAYLSVVALLVNSYLNSRRDSEAESKKLHQVWGRHLGTWRKIKSNIAVVAHPATGGVMGWQHNLPLMGNYDGNAAWSDHHTSSGIGKWFVWESRYPHWIELNRYWQSFFPGFGLRRNKPRWVNIGEPLNDNQYKASSAKKYTRSGFINKELVENRNHRDNQIEGAGFGLLFLRMLLTHINPAAYPPPVLAEDKAYEVLPWPGAEPLAPQLLHHAYTYSSKEADPPYKIGGKTDSGLKIIALAEKDGRSRFITAQATGAKRLKLDLWSLNPSGQMHKPVIYRQREGITWKRSDKLALAQTNNHKGDHILIVADRAEEIGRFVPVRKHRLRLSIWRVESVDVTTLLNEWISNEPHSEAIRDLDITLVGKDLVVVYFATRHAGTRIKVFKLDLQTGAIRPLVGFLAAGANQKTVAIAAAHNNVVVYPIVPEGIPSKYYLCSAVLSGSNHAIKSRYPLADGKVLDITSVKKNNDPRSDNQATFYIIAAVVKNDYLSICAWEVKPDGRLVYTGQFDTKNGEKYLIGREAGYERASITSVDWKDRPGFVIAAQGIGREVRYESGRWLRSAKGLKIIYGYIMKDGRPTIECSNLAGSGNSDDAGMLDIAGPVGSGHTFGVVSAHKTADDHLQLIYWKFRDDFEKHRWSDASRPIGGDSRKGRNFR